MSFQLDTDDGSDPEFGNVLEFGWSGLVSAVKIWNLLGSEKGEKLRQMLDDELAIPEGDATYVTQSQIARLVSLLEGIETEAKGKLIDDAWNVLPEQEARVAREAPLLGEYDVGPNGRYLTLVRPISETTSTRAFLQRAQRIQSDITIR